MSRGNPYANGTAYPDDRYGDSGNTVNPYANAADDGYGDGAYGGYNGASGGAPPGEGRGGRAGAGRDRRAGGYGGFYEGGPAPRQGARNLREDQSGLRQGARREEQSGSRQGARREEQSGSRQGVRREEQSGSRTRVGGDGYESSGSRTREQGSASRARVQAQAQDTGEYEGGDWRRRQRAERERGAESDGSRSRERNGSATGGGVNGTGARRTNGRVGGGRGIDDVLQFIQQEWDFMTLDECVPVQVALQLMDPSSLGRADRYNEFQQTHTQLQRSLKSIVNEHHQGFNSSIGTFHKIQSSIQTSQGRIRYLKGSLGDAKGGLLTTKPELKGLATSSQSYDDTLQLLGQVENLQRVTEKLEARISEKRFLSSVDILQDALRLVRRSELEHISALSDMRSYFSNQETTLTDILIEELHDHLYLKSPYCQDRWKASHDGEKAISDTMGSRGLNSWERPVYLFLSNLDTSTQLVEDASRNPEADSFYYIQVILESLNKMGHLDMAVDRIEHRLPVELYSVVDKTNAEVDHRHPDLRRNDVNEGKRKTALPNESTEGRGVVLSEFLWTLYSKFEAIAEGHRVVHEVVTGIVEREKIRDSKALTGGFRELWKLYQSEMRSLLHDYLAHKGGSTFGSGTTGADGGNMFQRRQRDKTKKMFKLSEMDQKSKEMIQEQEALDEILKTSVPGLVSKSRQSKSGSITDSTRVGQDSSGTGHKLLVDPSVFNMSLLLPPSLSFLQRLKDIVPLNSDIVMSTLTSFLDEFLVNVFHPQLDEAVTELCTQSFMELDAFQEDPTWSSYSPKPIFKGTVKFMNLIRAFSKMLNSIPHDQIFTQLIINQLISYYDRCNGWYQALVTRAESQNESGLKPAAALAAQGELHDVTESLWEAVGDDRVQLLEKETMLLLQYTNETAIQPYDLISDPKNVVALSLLYNSLQWLSSNLRHLRHITPHQTDSSSTKSSQPPMNRRWTLISSLSVSAPSATPTHLPLTPATAIFFDNALLTYVTLSHLSLSTLRLDLRLASISLLALSLQGPILLPSPATSASPPILNLNADLGTVNQSLTTHLNPKERRFITSGLARLVDRKFVSGATALQTLNRDGASRILIDVLVAGKGLRDIIVTLTTSSSTSSPSTQGLALTATPDLVADESIESLNLPLSTAYYSWFLEGAPRVVELAKREKEKEKEGGLRFTYEELKTLVELCFSEALGNEEREVVVGAKRGLADCLLGLGEGLWDS